MKQPVNIIEELVDNYLNGTKYKYKIFIDPDLSLDKQILKEFIDFCLEFLKIENDVNQLKIVFSSEKKDFTTYAYYDFKNKIAAVYCKDRALLDCLRSLAHELVHYKQDIKQEIAIEDVSIDNDGVEIENEANSIAGVILRKFGRLHKELY